MNEVITLNTDSPEIQHLCKVDKRLDKVISMVGAISYQLYADPYDFLIHEIIEQMLSVKSGYVIYSRLEKLCDGKIIPEVVGALTIKEIRSIGTSYSKADYIKSLTHSVMSGEIDFEAFKAMSDEEVIKHLTNLKGIGMWTAHMYLIFVLIQIMFLLHLLYLQRLLLFFPRLKNFGKVVHQLYSQLFHHKIHSEVIW